MSHRRPWCLDLEGDESCDDGNGVDGDGCSSTCEFDAPGGMVFAPATVRRVCARPVLAECLDPPCTGLHRVAFDAESGYVVALGARRRGGVICWIF